MYVKSWSYYVLKKKYLGTTLYEIHTLQFLVIMTFSQLCIIVNDYAQVFNRFNISRSQVAKLSAGHVPYKCSGTYLCMMP